MPAKGSGTNGSADDNSGEGNEVEVEWVDRLSMNDGCVRAHNSDRRPVRFERFERGSGRGAFVSDDKGGDEAGEINGSYIFGCENVCYNGGCGTDEDWGDADENGRCGADEVGWHFHRPGHRSLIPVEWDQAPIFPPLTPPPSLCRDQ